MKLKSCSHALSNAKHRSSKASEIDCKQVIIVMCALNEVKLSEVLCKRGNTIDFHPCIVSDMSDIVYHKLLAETFCTFLVCLHTCCEPVVKNSLYMQHFNQE